MSAPLKKVLRQEDQLLKSNKNILSNLVKRKMDPSTSSSGNSRTSSDTPAAATNSTSISLVAGYDSDSNSD